MSDENGGYKISDRLLRLSTPRKYTRADGGESGTASGSNTARPGSPKKVMTAEELEASTSRMYSQTRKSKELPPIVKSRRMAKEEEEKSTNRLYRDAVETQRKKRALSAEKARKGERCETKVVPQEEIDALVSRMHDKSAEVAKRKAELLEKKYDSRPATAVGGDKRLTKNDVIGVGNRLCNEDSANIRSSKASLYEKYVLARLVKGTPMSQEELIEGSARLYRNEPRTD